MNTEEDRLARATISLVAEPGDVRCLGLARELGPHRFLEALREHPDLREPLAAAAERLTQVDAERVLEDAGRRGIRFVVPGDGEWPRQLDDLDRAGVLHDRGGTPAGLWVRGPFPLNRLGESVAVVGARSATTYGAQIAADLAAAIGEARRPVVSGAAIGIDYAAHRGALSAGAPTVAVLACGVDRAYPAQHRDLLRHLGEFHAIVSEAPPGAAPFSMRFLARNRLIAGLTRGTLVVEAALRSGALNTSSWAERLNRVVMAVPGPLTSAASQGVHQLLRRGSATLVTSGEEILELVGLAGEDLAPELRAPERPRDKLSARARQVLDAVPVAAPVPVESIARVAGLAPAEVRRLLVALAEEGFVEPAPTGWRLSERALGRDAPAHLR